MRISAKGEYATRALVDLALREDPTTPVQVRDIATRQNIPMKYLVQILLVLKSAGLVESRRGVDGGYRLARPADAISLGEVVRAVEGPILPLKCFDDRDGANSAWPFRNNFCSLWGTVRDSISDVLDGVTLSDLARQFEEPDHMYYI